MAFVGDLAGMFGLGTSGEGCDAEDLRLPGHQAELVEALLETGTPVVIVVVSGRPYALGQFQGRAAGLIQAFMPGQAGGAAIAGVLSGRVQPSGKLPVQIPRHAGGQPSTYLQPALGGPESAGISNLDAVPLFPFGYGASYTSFAIDDLRLSDTEISTDGEFTATVRVRNTGARAGDEVVQLYLHDVQAQVARPLKQLIGFARVSLDAAAALDVEFSVHADRTAFTGVRMQRHRGTGRHRGPGRDLRHRPAVPSDHQDDRTRARRRPQAPARHPGKVQRLQRAASRCLGGST